MISSYYPPTKSSSSNSSTPQRSVDSKDTLASPNFDSIPVDEILKSAPTRSAFLQSLQKSREREERREKERDRELNSVSSVNNVNSENFNSNSYDKGYDYDRNNFNSNSNSNSIDYLEPKSLKKSSSNYDDFNFNNLQQSNKLSQSQSNSSPITPTLTRRRISNSSVSNNNNNNNNSGQNNSSSSTLKHLNNSTPTNQSKLAVHAFTMSRSSNDDENENNKEISNEMSSERSSERSINRSNNRSNNISNNISSNISSNISNNISNNISRESYGGLSSEFIDSKSKNYNDSIKFTSTPQRSTLLSTINAFPVNSEDSDFKRRYEEQFFSKTNNNTSSNTTNTSANTTNTSANNINTSANNINTSANNINTSDYIINTSDYIINTSNYQKDISSSNSPNNNFNNKQIQMQMQMKNTIDPSQSLNYEIIKNLIDTTLESHTISLKNDLQNLHVEIIKQSLIQQNSLQRLLETYLPLTGKLMESLEETRDENLKLKKRIDELNFSRR